MKYLRLFEDFVKNEGPEDLEKKPVKVKVDEAEQEDGEEEVESKPAPQQLKKKTNKEEEENEFLDEEDEPEIIREFKAHLRKMEKRK